MNKLDTPGQPTLDAILSAHVRSWQIARKRAEELEGPPPTPLPVITLSRQMGVDGEAIAGIAAANLGLSLWNREIVHAIAEKSGLPDALFETLDEHARTQLQEFLGALFSADREAYVYARELSRVIATVAHHGAAVIVGHGAEFVVQKDRALRVRAVGSLPMRVRAHAQSHDLDLLEAERLVLEGDREERAFCRQYFGVEDFGVEHYDLIVNRDKLDLEAAARIIETAYRARFPRTMGTTS